MNETYLDKTLTIDKVKKLTENYIYPLKTIVKKNSSAKYRCKLCDYFCSYYDVAINHCNSKSHSAAMKAVKQEIDMREMFLPDDDVLGLFNKYLIDFYQSNCIQQKALDDRYDFVYDFKVNFLLKYPDAQFNLYGSTVTGICLGNSSIDIDVQLNNSNASETLDLVYQFLLVDNKSFRLVSNENGKRVTNADQLINDKNQLVLKVVYSNVEFTLCLTSGVHHSQPQNISKLILFYTKLDERFKILAFCLRHLAKITHMDQVDMNMLSPCVFPVMALYFLQSVEPSVLPIIHNVYGQTQGQTKNDDLLYDDKFECYLKSYMDSMSWKSENSDSIGLLWLNMLAFYSFDYTFKDVYLSVRSKTKAPKTAFKIHGKKIAIEDPMRPQQNLCRTLLTQTNDFLFETIRKACLSFTRNLNQKQASPSAKRVKLIDQLVDKIEIQLRDYTDSPHDYEKKSVDGSDSNLPIDILSAQLDSSLQIEDDDDEEIYDDQDYIGIAQTDSEPTSIGDNMLQLIQNIVDKIAATYDSIYMFKPNVDLSAGFLKLLHYEKHGNAKLNDFWRSLSSKKPPLVCTICNKEGHLNKHCPKDIQTKLEVLPPLTESWIYLLTKICCTIMERSKQTNGDKTIRDSLLYELENIIKEKYDDVQLHLFGSSNNGFCMKKSDLDICLTLKRCPTGEKIETSNKRIIKNVSKLLRQHVGFDQIEARMAAKVPIVKFRHKKSKLEGDISVYNTLAIHNTQLLKSYTKIDKRLVTLGNVVKHFAKVCSIGDASCGSLSSYAYIIMMIHYLMHTEPPVLPCLQTFESEAKKKRVEIVDGWNCWFFNDLDAVPNIWPYYGKNKSTVGELWLGFLRYYTEVFDWKAHVVTIKDTIPLTRKSKNWPSEKARMAIEDPFKLNHNLAAGVSHRMGLFILSAFINARSVFGKVDNSFTFEKIDRNSNIADQFFNWKCFVVDYPPMDRGCFVCAKIGHSSKDCPNVDLKARNPKNSRNNEVPQCYSCNTKGHLARDCTDVCLNCKNIGHSSRTCKAVSHAANTIRNGQSTPENNFYMFMGNYHEPTPLGYLNTSIVVHNTQHRVYQQHNHPYYQQQELYYYSTNQNINQERVLNLASNSGVPSNYQ